MSIFVALEDLLGNNGRAKISLDEIVGQVNNGAVDVILDGVDVGEVKKITIDNFDQVGDAVNITIDLSTFTSDFDLNLNDESAADSLTLEGAGDVTVNPNGSRSVSFIDANGEERTLKIAATDAAFQVDRSGGLEIGPGVGRDELVGADGDDTIVGGGGDDTISGGDGADSISAGGDQTSLGGSGLRSKDFPLIKLTNHADIDTDETNGASENAADLLGAYGGEDDPLSSKIVFAYSNDLDDNDRLDDNDGGRSAETFTIEGEEIALDSVQTYFATVQFADGSSGEFTAVVIQLENGDVYLAPEPFENSDSALLESGLIQSITLNQVEIDNTNLYGLRLDSAYQIGDADIVDAGAGDDTVDGGQGDDLIEGGTGGDLLIGGTGADELFGGSGDDVLEGGSGEDYLKVGSGADIAYGGAGADTLQNASGDDQLFGGSGDDSLIANVGNDSLFGGSGDDTLTSGSGEDSLDGGLGADSLVGGGGDDTLLGGAGDDRMEGGDDDDLFVIEDNFDADTIVGGEGGSDVDTVDLSALSGPVTATHTAGVATTVTDGNDTLSFTEVERLILTDGDDIANLQTENPLEVFGGAGADTLAGSDFAGAGDTLDGGSGDDSLFGDQGEDVLEGGSGRDALDGGADDDTLFGGAGDDTLFAGFGSDRFEGGSGDDSYDIGGSNVSGFAFDIDLASGSDTYGNQYVSVETVLGGSANDTVQGAGVAERLEGAGGDDQLFGGSGDDTLAGGSGDDVLDGGSNNDTLIGGAGDDTLLAGFGSDRFEGGSGDDTYDIGGSNVSGFAFNIDLAAGADTFGNQYDSIETVLGGTQADTVQGAAVSERLEGAAGDDQLFGGAGDDTILGGSGDDSLRTGSGNDQLFGGAGEDTLRNSSGDDSLVGGSGDDLIVASIGRDTLEGEEGDDTLVGGSGDDSLFGGEGDDQLFGGSGDDQAFGGSGDDVFLFADNFGSDTIFGGEGGSDSDTLDFSGLTSSVRIDFSGPEAGTVTSGGDTLTFSEIERFILTDGDDLVIGSNRAGSHYIESRAGDDQIESTDGDDTVYSGSGDDSIDGNFGADEIFGGQGQDTLDGDEDDDTLFGGSGDDLFLGGEGQDQGFGGAGDDTFEGGSGDDSLLGGSGDDVIFGESGDDTLFGGSGSNSIEGGDGADSISGGDQGDTIFGGDGADTISTGAGFGTSDSVFGGAGADRIVTNNGFQYVEAGSGDDTIVGSTEIGTAESDTLFGGDGNDSISSGFAGSTNITQGDLLDGGAGDDTLVGGDAYDTLDGGAGDDSLTGGEGFDTFVISSGDDTISDFGNASGATLNDGDQTNNDFVDLSAFYDTLSEVRADFADDGVLNQSNTEDDKGRSVDYSDNTAMSGGTTFQGVASSSAFTSDNTNVVCFAAGAQITTPKGPVDVAMLQPGDLVDTLDRGPQPILWVGRRILSANDYQQEARLRPVLIREHALGAGAPSKDLIVSAQHRMLVRGPIVQRMFGNREVLAPAKALVGYPGVEHAPAAGGVTLIHILLAQHSVVFANNAASETFYPGETALKALSDVGRAAVHAHLPALRQNPLTAYPPARPFVSVRQTKSLVRRLAKNGKPLVDRAATDESDRLGA